MPGFSPGSKENLVTNRFYMKWEKNDQLCVTS